MTEFIVEFWGFLKVRKKFWLLPIVLFLGLLGGLLVKLFQVGAEVLGQRGVPLRNGDSPKTFPERIDSIRTLPIST